MIKNYIVGTVTGICIAVTCMSVWSVINLTSRVSNLETAMTQVVSIIQKAQAQNTNTPAATK